MYSCAGADRCTVVVQELVGDIVMQEASRFIGSGAGTCTLVLELVDVVVQELLGEIV